MQSILLSVSLSVILYMTCSGLLYDLPIDVSIDPLVEKCLEKDKEYVMVCVFKTMSDWNITAGKPIDPHSRQACCASWEMFDCIELSAKVCIK